MKVQFSNVFARFVAVLKGKHCGKAFIFNKGENGSRFLGFIKLQKMIIMSGLIKVRLYGAGPDLSRSSLRW